MSQVEDDAKIEDASTTEEGPRLFLADWMWHPWYAKLLWACTTLFWTGGALSLGVPALSPAYNNAFAGILFSVLFPPLVALYLGVGFVRAHLDYRPADGSLADVAPVRRRLPWGAPSMGGYFNDPTADSLDPRSGYKWRHKHIHRFR
jgi:hypothetical protein